MNITRVIPMVIAGSLAWSGLAAQTGSLVVRVSDEHGALPGATVTLAHPMAYIKETAVQTTARGVGEFPVLRPTGRSGVGYTVSVMMPGFAQQVVADIKVRVGTATELPVELSAEIVERIEVLAESEVVDLEQTSQSSKFSDEFIDNLPAPGRFYQNVLTLVPGVQDSNGDGNPNVHGSRDRDFKAIVGGVSNVDPLTGQQMSQVNPNSIEEMEVITAGAGVEFSRAQGGFARILQKQGSNEFEGALDLFYRSSLLDGDGAGDRSDLPTPEFAWLQPAVQVSGPIVRDKLWYRLSHEIIDREMPTNVTNGLVVVHDEWGIHSDQITWQASPRNKLALQFQADPRTIDSFGVSSSTPAESAIRVDRGSETFGLTWTAPISSRVLVESRVAWQDLASRLSPALRDAPNRCIEGPDFLEGARCLNIDSGETSGSYPYDIDDHRQRLTVRTDATLFGGRLWGATHQVKLGMIVENERYHRDQISRPDIDFFVFQPGLRPDDPTESPVPQAIIFGEFSVPERMQMRATGITWGLYVEDRIKPIPNLTVTLGARIDREEIDSDGRAPFFPESEFDAYREMLDGGIPASRAVQRSFTAYEAIDDFYAGLAAALELPYEAVKSRQTSAALSSAFWDASRRAEPVSLSNTNLSPFLAIAWDPFGDGRTKLAATARRYYDKVFLQLPLIEIDPASAHVAFRGVEQAGKWVVPDGLQGLRSSISPAVNVDVLDRGLATPYQDELTLSFEREIAAEASIKLTYIDRKFRDQYQDVDLNHAPGDFGRCRTATAANPSTVVATRPGDDDFDAALAPGDGILDDCAGALQIAESSGDGLPGGFLLERPDGIPDLYVQNPGWGNVLHVGNFNRIDYEAWVLELVRRQHRNWELQGSYTWSKAKGDGEDFQQALGNDRSLTADEVGYQSYDQRHVVKISAATNTPWGIRLGGSLQWQSGLPYSILQRRVSFDAVPPQFGNLGADGVGRPRTIYPTGRRNDQRNDSHWDCNVRVSKELSFGRDVHMQISAEVFNLLNDDTYMIYDPITQSGQQINGNNVAMRRFGRQWQLGVELTF